MIQEVNVGIAIYFDGQSIRLKCNANVDGLVKLLEIAMENYTDLKEAIERITKKPDIEFTQTFTSEGINPFLERIENCKELYFREAGTNEPFKKFEL